MPAFPPISYPPHPTLSATHTFTPNTRLMPSTVIIERTQFILLFGNVVYFPPSYSPIHSFHEPSCLLPPMLCSSFTLPSSLSTSPIYLCLPVTRVCGTDMSATVSVSCCFYFLTCIMESIHTVDEMSSVEYAPWKQ